MREAKAVTSGTLVNAMSVDVEDYFQVWALSPVIDRTEWDRWPARVEYSTDRVLDLFRTRGIKSTFFVLGWVARRYPALVRRIVRAGHELASHGHDHHKVSELTPTAFFDDVSATRKLLEDQSSAAVRGYRAPSFSIGTKTWWAFDQLEAAGYAYSSSLHPIAHDHYGMPQAPRTPFRPGQGNLIEFPVATIDLGRRVSCAGGGYFRLLPYAWSEWCLGRHVRRDRLPATFYFHPWEIDHEQPRVAGLAWRSRVRHYINLAAMEGKLSRLLDDFNWARLDEVYDLDHSDYPHWRPEI